MNRMFTKQEIIDLIDEHAKPFDPSAIEEGDIPQDAVLGIADGEVVKGNLFGKYVKVIAPPASTTLTDTEKDNILKGAMVEGTFLSLVNPLFLPSNDGENGWVLSGRDIFAYWVNTSNEIIKSAPLIDSNDEGYGQFTLNLNANRDIVITSGRFVRFKTTNNDYLGQFSLPSQNIPADTDVIMVTRSMNGTWSRSTWVEFKRTYLHTIVFDVGSSQTFTLRFISDSSTPCELDAVTGNFTIPGSTFIQPANMGNVVIVPLDANKFAPDIYAFDSSTGAFTNNITLASVTSDTVTPIG